VMTFLIYMLEQWKMKKAWTILALAEVVALLWSPLQFRSRLRVFLMRVELFFPMEVEELDLPLSHQRLFMAVVCLLCAMVWTMGVLVMPKYFQRKTLRFKWKVLAMVSTMLELAVGMGGDASAAAPDSGFNQVVAAPRWVRRPYHLWLEVFRMKVKQMIHLVVVFLMMVKLLKVLCLYQEILRLKWRLLDTMAFLMKEKMIIILNVEGQVLVMMLLRFFLAVASMLVMSLMVFLMKVKLRFSLEVEGMDLSLMVLRLHLE
ncbi:unnamed protein product, partial [Prorocentrum cordatum]